MSTFPDVPMNFHLRRLLASLLVAVILALCGAACSKTPTGPPPDPEAWKKELKELNEQRKKEWGK